MLAPVALKRTPVPSLSRPIQRELNISVRTSSWESVLARAGIRSIPPCFQELHDTLIVGEFKLIARDGLAYLAAEIHGEVEALSAMKSGEDTDHKLGRPFDVWEGPQVVFV